MFTITEYTVELIKDPFGILDGARYEFKLDLDVEEDDELYTDNGVSIRVVYKVTDDGSDIVKYDLHEKSTDKYLDFDLEDDEVAAVAAFCKERYTEAKHS
jgi:hypothetical protein